MSDLPDMSEWLGREECAVERLCGSLTARLAALLDRPPRHWETGEAVPAHWYVQLFGSTAPQSTLGPDGHPPKGSLVPPIPWPRRMFAGRRVAFEGDLRIGDLVTRRSRVAAIEPKAGRSGPMCFVTLRHEFRTERGLSVTEEQDIVYRPAGGEAQAPRADDPQGSPDESPAPDGSRALTPDTTMLFRYSALTNNAHRIHYDAAYATGVEGYPALVVNGGFTTLLLWELAVATFGGALRRSSTRNVKPLFVDRPLTLNIAKEAGGAAAGRVLNDAGALALRADLEMAS